MTFSKIHPVVLGTTVGGLSGLSALFIGFFLMSLHMEQPLAAMSMGTIFITYSPSLLNSIFGAIAVSVSSFVGGYLTAWVYNFLLDRA